MRLTRTYLDAPLHVGSCIALSEAAFTHLVKVLRLSEGHEFIVFNGDGHDYLARLQHLGKRSAEALITSCTKVDNESTLRIQLAQAIARGEKMDWLLQKATELGVTGIAPIFTERTEVRLDAERGDKRMVHWRGVIASACEQSGRARLPELSEPMALATFVATVSSPFKLILDPQGLQTLNTLALAPDSHVTLVIGPEGGLSERDLATLKAHGFQSVRAGPRILRTETAGLAVIAGLQSLYGDWRSH